MIRGLVALLTSGILLNPMVIAGIICGTYIMNTLSESDVIGLFKNTDFYLGMFVVAFLFALIFERVYHSGGKRINWKVTLGIAFGRFVTLCITSIFTCLFIFSFTFGDNETTQHSSQEMSLDTLIRVQQMIHQGEMQSYQSETQPKIRLKNKPQTKQNEIIFK